MQRQWERLERAIAELPPKEIAREITREIAARQPLLRNFRVQEETPSETGEESSPATEEDKKEADKEEEKKTKEEKRKRRQEEKAKRQRDARIKRIVKYAAAGAAFLILSSGLFFILMKLTGSASDGEAEADAPVPDRPAFPGEEGWLAQNSLVEPEADRPPKVERESETYALEPEENISPPIKPLFPKQSAAELASPEFPPSDLLSSPPVQPNRSEEVNPITNANANANSFSDGSVFSDASAVANADAIAPPDLPASIAPYTTSFPEASFPEHSFPAENAIAAPKSPPYPLQKRPAEPKKQPDRDIVASLLAALDRADSSQRGTIVWNLGQQGDSRGIQPLVNLMLEADSRERGLISAALSEIGTRTLQPMYRALAIVLQDERPEVRKNGIRDLTRIYDALTQASQLVRHATNDPDPEVQETARWALHQLNRIRSLAEENAPVSPWLSRSSEISLPSSLQQLVDLMLQTGAIGLDEAAAFVGYDREVTYNLLETLVRRNIARKIEDGSDTRYELAIAAGR